MTQSFQHIPWKYLLMEHVCVLVQDLKIWDLLSHACLKTVHLRFPCQQPGRSPEHGGFPFLLLAPPLLGQPRLVVAHRDYLALLHLSSPEGARGPTGGRGPGLTCALFSSTLGRVAAGHADSSLSVWDVETGSTKIRVLNAHGEEAVTSMALDSTHRRLVTGSLGGTIKVRTCGAHVKQLFPGVTCH